MKGSGEELALPPGWWIVVDKQGALWRKCDVAILPAYSRGNARSAGPCPLLRVGGHLAGSGPDYVALPVGKWREIGVTEEILYTRPDQGGKFHPFKGRVVVSRCVGGAGFRLRLPDGCQVDALGFRKP